MPYLFTFFSLFLYPNPKQYYDRDTQRGNGNLKKSKGLRERERTEHNSISDYIFFHRHAGSAEIMVDSRHKNVNSFKNMFLLCENFIRLLIKLLPLYFPYNFSHIFHHFSIPILSAKNKNKNLTVAA